MITAAGTEADGSVTGELPQRPLALAADSADYLYLADPDSKAVWLVDTWQQEVARRRHRRLFEQLEQGVRSLG